MFKKIILILTVLFISSTNCFASLAVVRVAILNDADTFVISSRGNCEIMDPSTSKVLFESNHLGKLKVKIVEGKIYIGTKGFNIDHIKLVSSKTLKIEVGDKLLKYRGDILIHKKQNNKLLVVNNVDLEKYVRGVLYHEVSDKWPMEATMAQAVAVRSYVLYQMNENKTNLFDVRDDIYSQVYGGKSAERYRTNIAAGKTEGQVLLLDGKIFPTYFHSNCGGHTEDVNNVWGPPSKALTGVSCIYCEDSPSYHWKKNFSCKEVQAKLNDKGYKIGLIKDIEIVSRNQSNRIDKLRITSRDNQVLMLDGRKFRDIIGPNLIKSNNYEIEMKGYYFDVIGLGWGHGVGMCQWGAHAMAQERFTYKEILKYYYPNTEIKEIK